MQHSINAICLKTFAYGESSRITHYWTPEVGELRAMVKGVRKPGSQLAGACEVLTQSHLVLRSKQHALNPAELNQVTAVTCGERFIGLRQSLPAMAAGQVLAEWLLCHRQEPNSQALYDWLLSNLQALSQVVIAEKNADTRLQGLVKQMHYAQQQFMTLVGTTIEWSGCQHCQQPFPYNQPVYFAPLLGGGLCSTCRQINPGKWYAVGVSPHTWHLLAYATVDTECAERDEAGHSETNNTNLATMWAEADGLKLQQFWVFVATQWWQTKLPASQFWLDQLRD
jgi:DNA repair protein RecO